MNRRQHKKRVKKIRFKKDALEAWINMIVTASTPPDREWFSVPKPPLGQTGAE